MTNISNIILQGSLTGVIAMTIITALVSCTG